MALGGFRWIKIKLNGTHQFLVHDDDDDANILGGSVHTIQKNTEGLTVASKEIGLEANTNKTKYMVMSRDQMQNKVTI
jgi:hypothetical protein